MQEAQSTRPSIPMQPVVSSSNVSAFGYDPTTSTLAVEFKGGKLYLYPAVPASVFTGFQEAESKGSYFLRQVKPFYNGVLQKRDDADEPRKPTTLAEANRDGDQLEPSGVRTPPPPAVQRAAWPFPSGAHVDPV